MGDDRLLRIDELCELLQTSKASVFNWTKQGLMPSQIKIGRSSRWRVSEIEAWLAERPRGAYGEGG